MLSERPQLRARGRVAALGPCVARYAASERVLVGAIVPAASASFAGAGYRGTAGAACAAGGRLRTRPAKSRAR